MGKGPIGFSRLVGEVVDVAPLVVEWMEISRTKLIWTRGRGGGREGGGRRKGEIDIVKH